MVAPALAAPSGDEYLPKVPKATGDESVAAPSGGTGSVATSSGETTGSAGAASGQDSSSGNGEKSKGKKPTKSAQIAPTQAASDRSSGSGSTLFDPVILLIVGGVICVAAGMIMRRRQTKTVQYMAKKRRKELKGARPTPEGEIVGSGEKPL